MIFIGIVLSIIAIGILGAAFFMFAIWRAILGKSSVDLRLTTSIDIQTKRMEAVNKSMGAYSISTQNLTTEIKEAKRYLKELIPK